jgi:thioredoxin reductase
MYDVVIIGGGPAGLNAAQLLGRARRKVLVCDTDKPRNAASRAMHGFISRDGFDPRELRQIGRRELSKYDSIEIRDSGVVKASGTADHFSVTLDSGEKVEARRLLLAFGMQDQLPDIEGFRELWGRGVFPCPYCDGWEVRDQPLAALGIGPKAAMFALLLSKWSPNLILCTNGSAVLDSPSQGLLHKHGVQINEAPLNRIEGKKDSLRLHFDDGAEIDRRALFFHAPRTPSTNLAQQLGCAMSEEQAVAVNAMCQTSIPGVYAAGDLAHPAGLPFPPAFVVVAAAQGALAGGAIDKDLLTADLGIPQPATTAEQPKAA